ncbi:GntR family transcriptional regulator [Microbacterium sp. gxy059]|uniref:GntR family transcriptional regulator n=1 Tax=Microbacterium sp. gxy059 TaxID=2957199 RepID=UPI003D99171D
MAFVAAGAAQDSLGARAYREIWQRIVHLDYPPLAVLDEKALSADLGVGLSPIRQALRRLEYDGLVMILPRRGTLTTEVGLHAAQWELEIRSEIEALAARLAARRGSADQHARLLAHVDEMERMADLPSDLETVMRFTDLDSELHRMIYRQTGNPSLVADLERHFAHALRIWFYCHRSRPEPDVGFTLESYGVEAYREIAEAIAAREGDRAADLMRRHVIRDTEDALSLLRSASPGS